MSRKDRFTPNYFQGSDGKWSYTWVCPWCREKGYNVSDSGGNEATKELVKILCDTSINFHKFSGVCVKKWEPKNKG